MSAEEIQKMAEQAYLVFEAEGWTYGWEDQTPGPVRLAETITYLIDLYKRHGSPVSSGRFVVQDDDLAEDGYSVLLQLDGRPE